MRKHVPPNPDCPAAEMTKREYLTAMAMQALVSYGHNVETCAIRAIEVADETLRRLALAETCATDIRQSEMSHNQKENDHTQKENE